MKLRSLETVNHIEYVTETYFIVVLQGTVSTRMAMLVLSALKVLEFVLSVRRALDFMRDGKESVYADVFDNNKKGYTGFFLIRV